MTDSDATKAAYFLAAEYRKQVSSRVHLSDNETFYADCLSGDR